MKKTTAIEDNPRHPGTPVPWQPIAQKVPCRPAGWGLESRGWLCGYVHSRIEKIIYSRRFRLSKV